MQNEVIIDCFPESGSRYAAGYDVVVIDIFRATTTAVTAVVAGRRCFPAPSLEDAIRLSAQLPHSLLVGELGGNMPYGFDLHNSPAAVSERTDIERPVVLLSTSGTRLMWNARYADAVYVGCLRNTAAQVAHLAASGKNVAVLGAGARNEFREEDQVGCAWIAGGLIRTGYRAADARTEAIVERWRDVTPEAILGGKSAEYLRRSGQERDIEFTLQHIDDVAETFRIVDNEILAVPVGVPIATETENGHRR